MAKSQRQSGCNTGIRVTGTFPYPLKTQLTFLLNLKSVQVMGAYLVQQKTGQVALQTRCELYPLKIIGMGLEEMGQWLRPAVVV